MNGLLHRALVSSGRRLVAWERDGDTEEAESERAFARLLLSMIADDHGHAAMVEAREEYRDVLNREADAQLGREIEAWNGSSAA